MGFQMVDPFRRQLQGMMHEMHDIELQRTLEATYDFSDASESFADIARRLKGEKLLFARLQPYPNTPQPSPGPRGWVLLFFHYSAMRIIHDFHDLQDKNCRRCKLAIHPGMSCDNPILNETHYSKVRLGDDDPWPSKGLYLAFNHKSSTSNHAFTMTNGFNQGENFNRTIVIYNKAGQPQACGRLQLPDVNWYHSWNLAVPPEAPTTPV